ncbi:MAG: RluA family pseudouridine synthase [Bdellovibrionales bacterium]|nr:RluA family pseudouridine synthase [Bdellovibrionales bacterium]
MSELVNKIDQVLSSNYWYFAFHEGEPCPRTLLAALKEKLPHIQAESWQERLEFGGVYINGLSITNDVRICSPCKIEYYEPKYDYKNAEKFFPEFDPQQIVFKDDYIIAYYKPVGLPSIPTKEQARYNLRSYLQNEFNSSVHLPSRLDVSTGGLIVASVNHETHNELQKAFESRDVDKRYLLETSEHVAWQEKTEDSSIGRDPIHRVLRKAVNTGGKTAKTIFSLVKHQKYNDNDSSLIEAKPITGRTHQIRVHTKEVSTAIIGDMFYGGVKANYLRLLSYSLEFPHPKTKERLKISIPDSLLPIWAK